MTESLMSNARIDDDGWARYSIWEHSATIRELYAARCRGEAEEMTCVAQAAELLAPRVMAGDSLLDVGCGSGYFFHALRRRGIPVEYHGIDAARPLIEIGQSILPAFGLPPERLRVLRIEDMAASVDHVVCMNVLTNVDNYHRPLERILDAARKSVILRESCREVGDYRYVVDRYLDGGRPLRVHVNTYPRAEWVAFIRDRGFDVEVITDVRSGGEVEMVIDEPHHWTFFAATRRAGGR
jgi:SAM-dependent methyltransferase